MAVAVLAMTVVAGAGEKAQLIQPSIEIHQAGGLPSLNQRMGPVTVEYEIRVYNSCSEPITLKRVDLRSLAPVSSYRLRSDSRPFDVTIAPLSAEIVTYRALVYAEGSMIGSMTPVNLSGVLYFDSEVGGFAKPFTHIVTPKSQRTDS